jgi:hypothetical protein
LHLPISNIPVESFLPDPDQAADRNDGQPAGGNLAAQGAR